MHTFITDAKTYFGKYLVVSTALSISISRSFGAGLHLYGVFTVILDCIRGTIQKNKKEMN